MSRNALLVVVGCVIMGLFVATSNIYYVATAMGIMVLGVVLAWRFEAVLMIYVLVAFVPWGRTPDLAVGGSGLGKGLYVSQAMLGFLLIIWLIKYLFGSLPKRKIPTGFYWALGLHLAYSVVNVVNSYLFWDYHVDISNQNVAVNATDLALRFLSAGALVFVATTISNQSWLKAITWGILIAGFYNVLNDLTGGIIPLEAPWWPLLSLLPAGYALAVAIDGEYPAWKRLLATCVICVTVGIVFYKHINWVSGWLGLAVTLFTVALLKNRKVAVAMVVLAALATIVFLPFLQKNVVEDSEAGGDFDRFELLRGAVRYATTFPLGVGIGNYRAYNSFHYGREWGTTQYGSAHGTYAQSLAETGFLGFALLLALLISTFRWMYLSSAKLTGPSRIFLVAALGQMAGICAAALVGDYLVPTYHNGGLVSFSTSVYSWLIWGLAVAHVRLSGDQPGGLVDSNS